MQRPAPADAFRHRGPEAHLREQAIAAACRRCRNGDRPEYAGSPVAASPMFRVTKPITLRIDDLPKSSCAQSSRDGPDALDHRCGRIGRSITAAYCHPRVCRSPLAAGHPVPARCRCPAENGGAPTTLGAAFRLSPVAPRIARRDQTEVRRSAGSTCDGISNYLSHETDVRDCRQVSSLCAKRGRALASLIGDEYRPGDKRAQSDDEVLAFARQCRPPSSIRVAPARWRPRMTRWLWSTPACAHARRDRPTA